MASEAMLSKRTLDNTLLQILTEALLQVTHGVPSTDSARTARGLDLHHYGCLGALQALGDGGR
jgi:hypothetical protein